VPVLAHFNYKRPIYLETDVSGFAIAGIASQPLTTSLTAAGEEEGRVKNRNRHLIAFWSHTILNAERNYIVGNPNILAIVESCHHWRHHLEGSKYPI
jgi:hypothetical protein